MEIGTYGFVVRTRAHLDHVGRQAGVFGASRHMAVIQCRSNADDLVRHRLAQREARLKRLAGCGGRAEDFENYACCVLVGLFL